MEVTTTYTKAGKFDARFYHLVFQEEIGRVKGHFGPINSLKFHPDGKRYVYVVGDVRYFDNLIYANILFADIRNRASFLMLKIIKFRCYEAKIEESEKAGSHHKSNQTPPG